MPSPKPPAEGSIDVSALLAASSQGDPAAIRELCDRYYGEVQRLVHASLQKDLRRRRPWLHALFSTGDIVHEVFVGVLTEVGTFRGDTRLEFVTFLSRLTRNRLIDAVRFHEAARRDGRRVERDVEAEPPAPSEEPVDEMITAEVAGSVHRILTSLSARDRALLRGRVEDGESFGALAASLGFASADSARKTFRRVQARVLLRLQKGSKLPSAEASQ